MSSCHPHGRATAGALVLALLAALLGPIALSPTAAAEPATSTERRVAAASIATGDNHTCVVTTAQRVRCWGDNRSGQLGRGDTEDWGDQAGETPAAAGNIDLGARARAVAAGLAHTCALLVGGDVRCWGSGTDGQLGLASTESIGDDETPASAATVALGGSAIAITAGDSHTCALLASGRARCWGHGGQGQLGYGTTDTVGDDETPASVGNVPLGGRATALSAGRSHTCALMRSGAVRCWGAATHGQLGHGSTDSIGDATTPAEAGDVPLGGRAVALSAGSLHTCALLASGWVRCWGLGALGRLGYGNTDNIGDDETPAAVGNVPLGGRAIAVSAGGNHTCAVLTTGKLRCWGHNYYGQLGHGHDDAIGDDESASAGGDVPLGRNARAVATGGLHTCATSGAGTIRCWGYYSRGRLGHAEAVTWGDDPGETPAAKGDVALGATVRTLAPTHLRLSRWPRRDRRSPYVYRVKALVHGPFVADSATCEGRVKVVVRVRGKVVLTRHARVGEDCRVPTTKLTIRNWRLRKKNLQIRRTTPVKIRVTFLGTTNLERSARTAWARMR